MSETFRPITLESLAGVTPNAASAPGGNFNPLLQFASSAIRGGTSELFGLEGDWVSNVTGIPTAENDAWRQRNPWTSIGSQIVGAIPGYVASAAVTGPLAAAAPIARAAPWIANAFRAETMAAAPVRALATQGFATTVPISAVRLGVTPMLGGDLERVAASVGLDLAGSAVLGGGFGVLRGMRTGQLAGDYERILTQRIEGYNPGAPAQERLAALESFNTPDTELQQVASRTLDLLRQTVRNESAPRRDWIGPLEGMENPGEIRAAQQDLRRLFRPTQNARDDAERALRVQTFGESSVGFSGPNAWREALGEVGLPEGWERNIQFPRLVTARGEEAARVGSNIQRYLGESVGDGWHLRREANQDLFLVARELAPQLSEAGEQTARRFFIARTNAPERLLPQLGSLRRGDKLARFVGQAEENLLERAAKAMPEDDILRMGVESLKYRPTGLRPDQRSWNLVDHFPAPLANAAKELQPVANDMWRRFKSVAAPTIHRFKDRPLASYITQQARSVYEMAQGKAARALHGERPLQAPIGQIMRGLPDQGGLRKMFDGLKESDTALIARYAGIRESRKLSLDDALNELAASAQDGAALSRVEPLIREWDRVSQQAWQELVRTANATGTKVPKEVEGWAIPHVWPGDWRHRIRLDDGKTHIIGGRTREEARLGAEEWVKSNGGRLDPSGPFQTDRQGDYELLGERNVRRIFPESVRTTEFSNVKTRKNEATGGYVGDLRGQVPTKEELWDILSNDITLKYRDIAQRTVKRTMEQTLLPEVRSRYGLPTYNEVVQNLNTLRGEQGTFSRWQNNAMKPLDPLLGKNSASKIAATMNAVEAHLAFGFGNLSFPAGNAVTFLQTIAPKIALMKNMAARGDLARFWEIADFYPHIGNDGVTRGVVSSLSPVKLGKAAFRDLINPTPQQQQFFNRAVEEGVIAARIKDEYLGQKSRIAQNIQAAMRGEEPITNLLRAGAGVNMAIPHRVEELTRAHAFFTWLRAGELVNMSPDAMYEFAKRMTWNTMYGYGQADRPRIFTGPVGMMGGLFKNWMMNYIGDMGLYAKEAMRGNFGGLLWAMGGATAFAGIGGLPLYAVVDQFQRMLTDKPMVEELYGSIDNTRTADALYYGLPGLFGVSLQGMMAAPFNDPRRDLTFMFNAVALDRARKIGQAAGDIWDRWEGSGVNPLEQDRTWDQLTYAMSPRTLYRYFAQVEDGALKSIRNGRPIIEGVSEVERGLNAIGFTSTNIARAWEASESLWRDQERRRAATTMYAEAYSDAMTAGDSRGMNNALQRAIMDGVDISTMMRGAMERQRNLMQPQIPFDYLRMPGAYDRLRALRVVE